jgi:threonine dehydratase
VSDPTPLEPAPTGLVDAVVVYLKREDLHPLGAFKWRGALPVVRGYRDAGLRTVVTASTGNHGAATAWAAREVGLGAVVFVPERASEAKLARIEALGAALRHISGDFDQAKNASATYAHEHGLPLFVDGAEPVQYAAYRSIGEEIAAQLGGAVGTVVVPLGNGALIGGVGEALHPRGWRVVGVVAKDAPVMADSYDAASVQLTERGETIADGLAVRVAIPYAVGRIQPVVDEVARVSERALALAIGRLAQEGIRVEASAAASLAALAHVSQPAEPVVLILTGGNIDDELFDRACADPNSFPD